MRRRAVLTCTAAIGLAACGTASQDRPAAPVGAPKEQKAAEADPSNPGAWAAAVRAWITSASSGDQFDQATGEYTAEGEADLRRAVAAWERYVALDDPDEKRRSTVATRMVQAFVALDEMPRAADAQEIVAASRRSVSAYAQLAVLAYQAGQERKGDLAAAKAVELEDASLRRALRGQLEDAKKQAALLQG